VELFQACKLPIASKLPSPMKEDLANFLCVFLVSKKKKGEENRAQHNHQGTLGVLISYSSSNPCLFGFIFILFVFCILCENIRGGELQTPHSFLFICGNISGWGRQGGF
jgi:hypothetical protein